MGLVAGPDAAPPDRERLGAMCESVRHRGPDDEGVVVRDRVGFGVRRLAVIDPAGGRQPYLNEDGMVCAVFNGEIYNFRELRRELVGNGHEFVSNADGEVLVHLWEEVGEELPRLLNGMFAFAIHDSRRRCVFLCRDRIGIKPLYYSLTSDHLVFGSEVKAILASEWIEGRLDVDGLGQLLAWEYVPAPGTLLEGVSKLEPATAVYVDLDTFRPRSWRWWDLPPTNERNGDVTRTEDEWVEAVDAKLREATRRQLVSDVPLGAFLSGGVDSSLVVANMGDTRAFTIGFEDPSYSEVRWAERVAASLGLRHSVEVIRPEALDLFEDLGYYLDDPIGDFSVFPTYLVSRYAREEVTVALSGDGGDELFGGYETYVAQEYSPLWSSVPSSLRRRLVPLIGRIPPRAKKKGWVNRVKRFAEGGDHDPALGHARWRLFVGDALRRELFTPEALGRMRADVGYHIRELSERAGPRGAVDRALYVDLNSYLPDNCLAKVDRMSMACSLEVRVPFLDHELVELAFSIPPNLKVTRRTTKPLLKKVAARHVPRECVYRQKEGFSIPIKRWLRTELRPALNELLNRTKLCSEGIFRPATVTRLEREHLEGAANHSHILWTLLVFEQWRERFGA